MPVCHCVDMSKGLTLGQFRKLTAHLHPETEIILDEGNNGDWYLDVSGIALPEGENGYMAITLFYGDTWSNIFPADEPADLVDSSAPTDANPLP